MAKRVSGIVGFFNDDNALLDAAKKTYAAGFRDFDTLSPFPIHGMDDAMGLKASNVPWFTFVAGTAGLIFGLGAQWWTHSVNWPLNVGGKPLFSLPAYIPITFEMTVLFGALITVGGMLYMSGLPKVHPPVIDPDITSHKFAIFIPETDKDFAKAEQFLKGLGASDVRKVAEF